ncbi:MAG: cytochrome d ubiquinol oxidase subunit II [Akkermansiaceae bacterium]|nr:cytochrome d ubiquinol oxidase subunit II [Akkermansiaceae bacterium]
MDYNMLWFVLVGILFAGYAMLDGFDLGVGALILRIDDDHERRVFYNAIGPVWDGNEVWLVTGGGALFAAFPPVYATVFSGFYMAFMLLLFALIFRAVAIEFRSKEPWPWWRRWWDRGFCAGSTTASLLIGVAMGNIVWGIPLDANGEFAGTFLGLLHPYALLMGVTTVVLFMMHGAIYLHLKTEGTLQAKVRSWINPLIIAFIVCFALTTLATLLYVPRMVRILQAQPALFGVVVALVLVVANLPREIHRNRDAAAFVSSCLTMLLLMALFGLGMFPHLVYSVPDPAHSLTAYNASSTGKTLKIMSIIAAIGVPIVLAYTISVYYIFRGKVKVGKDSY